MTFADDPKGPPPRGRAASISLAAPAIVGALVSSFTAAYLLHLYLPSFNTPHTTLEGVPHRRSAIPAAPALARRVVLIMVDGLAFEDARALEGLAPLRERGTLRCLDVDFPSYTSPAITSFVTGLGPRDSGVRLNGNGTGTAGIETVLDAAADAKVKVLVRTQGWKSFEDLVRPPPGSDVRSYSFGLFVEMIRRTMAGPEALPFAAGAGPSHEIGLVYLGDVDEAGHAHGRASREYAETARAAAAFVVRYARSLDLSQDALVAVSDHGHLARGGHGGSEPEVRRAFFLGVGGPFQKGVELPARPMRDVASTLSVLSGVPTPGSNLGRPMLDALSLDGPASSRALASPFDQAARFACALHPSPRCAEAGPLAARLAGGDPAARAEAEALHDALGSARDERLAAEQSAGAQRRLSVAVVILALAAAALASQRGRLRLREGLDAASFLLPIVNLAVFAVYLLALGYAPTFSRMGPGSVFMSHSIPGGLLAALAVGLVSWFTRPARLAPWVLLLATVVPFALLAAWVGHDPRFPPPPVAGVLVFELGPSLVSASAGAVLVTILALLRPGPGR